MFCIFLLLFLLPSYLEFLGSAEANNLYFYGFIKKRKNSIKDVKKIIKFKRRFLKIILNFKVKRAKGYSRNSI